MFKAEGRGVPAPSLRDTETLLRSLVGVASASVTAAPDGSLQRIDVVAEPGTGERQLVRNVLSALRARFGVALDPASISINPDRADNAPSGRPGPSPGAKPAPPAAPLAPAAQLGRPSGPVSGHADTAITGSNGSAASNGDHASGTGNGVHRNAADPAARTNGLAPALDSGRLAGLDRPGIGNANGAHAHFPIGANGSNGSNGAHANTVRLEATELLRLDRALRCRVVVALGNERFVGIADALEDRPSEIDLAARVTLDALRAARTPREPVHFEGAATATVAGRQLVVVALRIWSGTDFDAVAGAEPVSGSAAEAAARAVIRAVNARLH
jgi:hypothetical protein